MKFKFFTVPILDSEAGEKSVNEFCAVHAVAAVDKHFVPDGADSFWAFCITWRPKVDSPPPAGKNAKIDYRTVLNEQDFQLFVKLWDLRMSIADSEGVPAYALFTNDQLAGIVQKKIVSRSELAAIEGVGAARIGFTPS